MLSCLLPVSSIISVSYTHLDVYKRQEQPPSVSAPEPPPQPEKPPEAHSSSLDKEAEPSSGGLLENLFRDKEKTIILALLILLGSEEGGQNHELMFALLFLLM